MWCLATFRTKWFLEVLKFPFSSELSVVPGHFQIKMGSGVLNLSVFVRMDIGYTSSDSYFG